MITWTSGVVIIPIIQISFEFFYIEIIWIAHVCLKVIISVQHFQVICLYRKLLVFFKCLFIHCSVLSCCRFASFSHCSEVYFHTVLNFPAVFQFFQLIVDLYFWFPDSPHFPAVFESYHSSLKSVFSSSSLSCCLRLCSFSCLVWHLFSCCSSLLCCLRFRAFSHLVWGPSSLCCMLFWISSIFLSLNQLHSCSGSFCLLSQSNWFF